MCLILVAWQRHARFPLVIAANRDEFHARHSAPLGFWAERGELCAGRDLQAGGTWLGVTRGGRFATVTNYRGGQDAPPGGRSRGCIPLEVLDAGMPLEAALARIDAEGERFAGFSLLAGEIGGDLFYLSNRERGVRRLCAGIYGLANDLLDTPWPKVERGKAVLDRIVQRGPEADALFALLADRHIPNDAELPHEDLPIERRRMLAPLFITSPEYGTRASTVVIADGAGRMHVEERRFTPDAQPAGGVREVFGVAARES